MWGSVDGPFGVPPSAATEKSVVVAVRFCAGAGAESTASATKATSAATDR
jgi:hypothetical protein